MKKSDCYNKINGVLNHEDCENYLPNCTLNNV